MSNEKTSIIGSTISERESVSFSWQMAHVGNEIKENKCNVDDKRSKLCLRRIREVSLKLCDNQQGKAEVEREHHEQTLND